MWRNQISLASLPSYITRSKTRDYHSTNTPMVCPMIDSGIPSEIWHFRVSKCHCFPPLDLYDESISYAWGPQSLYSNFKELMGTHNTLLQHLASPESSYLVTIEHGWQFTFYASENIRELLCIVLHSIGTCLRDDICYWSEELHLILY